MRPGMSRNETMSLKSNGNSAANSPVSTAECRMMGECSKGIYSDFAPVRKALNVAIHFVKRRARDVQCSERCVGVKARNRWNVSLFSLGLRQHKPISPKPEGIAWL